MLEHVISAYYIMRQLDAGLQEKVIVRSTYYVYCCADDAAVCYSRAMLTKSLLEYFFMN